MKSRFAFVAFAAQLVAGAALAGPDSLLDAWRQAGAGPFDPESGARLWAEPHTPSGGGEPRSCSGCHGTDLTQSGRHLETGKSIAPMALSVNPERLTDPVKTERWLKRNCRWTLGRECTPQEKGDIVALIRSR
jgi:hypothetical protein